jgi:uncharacterized membrane protein YdbT with pleckstrin-like domain
VEPNNAQSNSPSGAPQPPFKKVSPLTSLASYPCNIRVHGQNNDEKILLFIREHRIILFFNLLFYSIILFVPFLIQLAVRLFDRYLFDNTINTTDLFESKYWLVFSILWFAYVLKGYINVFLKWFYNINILTDNRLMDIDFLGIFKVRTEEASVVDIEDVKETQSGIVQSIFNMGDLEVLTASGVTAFNLDNVPKSHKIRDFMMDVVVAERKRRGGTND